MATGAFAQKAGPRHRIGVLSSLAASARDDAFVAALAALGYREGETVHFERRYTSSAHIEQAVRDLAQQNVDIIFAPTTIAAVAAKRTVQIPIVFATAPDPVGSGLVASLARPAGNATGTTSVSTELNAKRLQLLKDAFPHISRVAVVRSKEPVVAVHLAEIESAARALGLALLVMDVAARERLAKEISEWRADALYVIQSTTNFNNRKFLVELAAKLSLPAIYPYRESVEAGGLMSYGADFDELYRRAAAYVDKILKGGKPQDLPVEQPTKFELVVNRRTATALKARISPAVLSQTDKVIE
jgi:putative tryptophan/tyrosine transport system substrate-binding protein